MLKIISGVPGSGKTYWAVDYIDKFSKQHHKKKPGEPLPCLHNIDELKLGTTFAKHEETSGFSVHDLFSYEWHKKHKDYRGYLFVVDEAQSYWRKGFKSHDTLLFFEKHRHLGIDLILLTQDIKLLSPEIAVHCELHLRAASDTANPFPWLFLYQKMVGWEAIGRVWLRKKQSVFDLYKTADFDQGEVRKKSRPMFILLLACTIGGPAIGGYLLWDWVSEKKGMQEVQESRQLSRDQNGPPSSVQKSASQAAAERFNANDQVDAGLPETYPPSLQEFYQGVVMRLNVINTGSRVLIFLGDMIFTETEFPYKILKTGSGILAAVVPIDVYQYEKNLADQRKLATNTDPNEPYYYHDTNTDRSSSNRLAGSGGIEAGASGSVLVY